MNPDRPWTDPWAIAIVALWVLGVAVAGPAAATLWRLGGGLLGLLLGVAVVRVWGPRTRPDGHVLWWLIGIVWIVVAMVSGNGAAFMWALPVGLAWRHAMAASPSLMLLSGGTLVLLQDGDWWRSAPEAAAWLLALGMLLVVMAAVLERDRLAALRGRHLAPWWQAARGGALVAWTVAIVALRGPLQSVGMFRAIGIDPATGGGRLVLLGLMLLSLALAGILLRQKPPQEAAWT